MEDYNTEAPRRGSFFGGGPRRGSFFGFLWDGDANDDDDGSHKEASAESRRASLQDRYSEMDHVRRGSFFGHHHHHHHPSSEKAEHHHTEKGRRASMFGSSSAGEGHHHHHRRGSLFSSNNRRGSIGSMATLSSITAKKRRGSMSGFFCRNNKIHVHEQNSEELAHQVMAAFADFDV